MFSLTIPDFILTMATGLFLMGLISLSSGIYLLFSKAGGRDIKTIARQTTKLAQKGMAEDVAGLVGNASSLVDALNGLVRTATGIGIFLIVVGFGLFASAFYLASQILS
jgi:hypothetical protein